jgi:hypothetical protein
LEEAEGQKFMRIAFALLLGLLILAFVAWRKIGEARRRAESRAHFFDDCLDLLEAPVVTTVRNEYPRLVGRLRGWEVQLTPVVDTLSVRKLPSLWLLVTVVRPTPLAGTFDLMMRPAGTEGFSNFHRLPETIEPPAGWPPSAVLRSDNPAGLPPAALIGRHLSLFEDPRAKELLISPKGVRLVVQADEAQRTYYLVLRQALFAIDRLDRDLAAGLVARAFAIHDDLDGWRTLAA